MSQFNQLSHDEQKHFINVINRYIIPEHTSHLMLNEFSMNTFVKQNAFMLEGESEWYFWNEGKWKAFDREVNPKVELYQLPKVTSDISAILYHVKNSIKDNYQSSLNSPIRELKDLSLMINHFDKENIKAKLDHIIDYLNDIKQ